MNRRVRLRLCALLSGMAAIGGLGGLASAETAVAPGAVLPVSALFPPRVPPAPSFATVVGYWRKPRETEIHHYLQLCVTYGASDCKDGVDAAANGLISIYLRDRGINRNWHRGASGMAGLTGAGLAVGGAFIPPVGLTAVGLTVASPIMLDGLLQFDARTYLAAAAVTSFQQLAMRYAVLRNAETLIRAKDTDFRTVESKIASDCTALQQINVSAFQASDGYGKSIQAAITNWEATCKTYTAVNAALDPLLTYLGDDANEDALTWSYAHDLLSLLDLVDSASKSLDPSPGEALGAMLAAPLQAGANLLKGGSSPLTTSPAFVSKTLSPVPLTQIQSVTVSTTYLGPSYALDSATQDAFANEAKSSTASVVTLSGNVNSTMNTLIADLNKYTPVYNEIFVPLQQFQTAAAITSITMAVGPPSVTFGAPLPAAPSTPANSSDGASATSGH